MNLLDIINKAIMVLCAATCAFCIGYAIVTKENHVFLTAAVYGLLAYLIYYALRSDRKREEENLKNKYGRD